MLLPVLPLTFLTTNGIEILFHQSWLVTQRSNSNSNNTTHFTSVRSTGRPSTMFKIVNFESSPDHLRHGFTSAWVMFVGFDSEGHQT